MWDTPSPYNSGNELDDLTSQGYGRTYGDLVHIVHRNGGGGVAYLDVLCSQSTNTGASGVNGSYNTVPTYSWDVMVIAHELGHNLGSPHTHACAWNGNNTAIDGCGPNAGYDEGCTAPLPSNGGTIMSYCHFNAGINFNLGFGTQPGDLIRNRVNNASCLSACGPPTCIDGYQNGNETGVDCGGPDCIACPTCVDGIQNGDEAGVDCGGPDCGACACANGAGVSLIINPDFYSNETTWTVQDASGNTVASGGPYGQGLAYIYEPICLPVGCYDFTIYDSYGDGLFDGARTGTYILVDESNSQLVSGAGNFGSQEMTNFCVTASTCAGVDLDINFDGFPSQTSWEISDANTGSVVTSGGSYGSQSGNSNLSLPNVSCLPDGCYELTFFDALGNGMCPFRATASSSGTFITPGTIITPGTLVATLGTVVTPGLCGNYTLRDATGAVLASGGGGFGAQEGNTFCLSGGTASFWQPDGNEAYAKQQQSFTELEVFPTLTSKNLFVYTSEISQGQINIVDMNGQIIQQYEQNVSQMQLNVSELPAGIYFVQVVAGDAVLVEKFVKQ